MSKLTPKDLEKRIKKVEKFLEGRKIARKNIVKFPSKNDEEDTGTTLPPDVVIAEAFGQLSEVVIGGIDKEGKWWFSCSEEDDTKVLWILENFKTALINAAPERDSNLGREV